MEWLIERFQSAPERIAFIHEGREVSYGGVVALIDDFYQRVQDAGIQRGETVVVLGDYSPEVFCMIMALCRNGSIVIPLTRTSVVEESVALGVSGCEWYVEFDAAGRDATITHRGLKTDNALLNEFRQRGTPGMVLFSSGSTGKPKGILHDFHQVAEKFRKQRAPVVAIPFLMIDHFGGINTILAITSSLGTVVTVADRSVPNICAAIEKYKVELLPATPSFLTLMMASNLQHQYDLSSLKRITYGTEVMPQSTLDRVRAQFPGVDLLQTYGLSEVGVLRSQSREDGSLWVRVGGEGFQTKVVDGVLWIKSQYAMVGYLNAPSEFDADGWFNTQDQVEVDGDYFRILGRVTDLINVAGQKVYPSEVESVILEMDNVQDVAVFGEKHAMLGNIVVAKVVVDSPESVDSLKKRIRQECLAHLAPFKVPAKVVLAEGPLHSVRQKKIRRE
ncbi:acyl-CoA synthetase (AMP-forming)/AMP-acid ligase II [Duganella sp. SG902]|uniref:class I adenylate-forming enzyme family protein n=1 Tax=Duganella sp. SG902 TaxID=2587016 RepID=UPI00159E4453|nr:fatty acid--CoA ligase family protein [Duganella sp. SG902]NVM79004.1 acyl-CoA synthetase (AMP-forming)/AMP-acid ligase II [Duganella sp. SG902]